MIISSNAEEGHEIVFSVALEAEHQENWSWKVTSSQDVTLNSNAMSKFSLLLAHQQDTFVLSFLFVCPNNITLIYTVLKAAD